MNQYTISPIDFNGKLEIFLKHLKKKILFCVCMCVWLDFDYFSGTQALLQAMSTLFFFKKKIFFCVDFNTNNFEIFSCQHVSAMLNFKFFFCQAICWHSTLTLTLTCPYLLWMGCEFEFYLTLNMLGWTLASLIQIYFYFIWIHPHSNLT